MVDAVPVIYFLVSSCTAYMACQTGLLFDAECQDTVQISVGAGIQAETVAEFNTSLHGNGTIINAAGEEQH